MFWENIIYADNNFLMREDLNIEFNEYDFDTIEKQYEQLPNEKQMIFLDSITAVIEYINDIQYIALGTEFKIQNEEHTQEELASKEFDATAGGGAVSVKLSGGKQIKELKISKDVVDPDDVEMLQDLIITCINDAMRKVDEAQSAQFGKYNIPGLM